MRRLTSAALSALLLAAIASPAAAGCTADKKQQSVQAPAPITTPAPTPRTRG